jgi:hypothetical protein
LTAHEIDRKGAKSDGLVICPGKFDLEVSAHDLSGFLQSLLECCDKVGPPRSRPTVEEADDRDCGLLRAGAERPGNCCAAEKTNSRRLIIFSSG